ncbi:MAG: peptidoglycan editing factor PgeF [Ardenticatenaceae bacterium]|nr:peptidoglycan editing factor PgeF [Ardenticatenaceae bacterium]
MKQHTQNGIVFFEFEGLGGNGRIQHAIFSRQGGISPEPFHSLNLSVSVADDKARVYANRSRAYGLFGRDTDTVVHAHLVHGDEVARTTAASNGTWVSRVDGLITNEPGCALTMNYADCAPIFLYDPAHGAIGLGHAGWMGAVVDLPGAMVRAMQREFGSEPAQLVAGIGPCIGPCCYEVDEPVIGRVHEAFAEPERLLVAQGNGSRPHFDLPQANTVNLNRAGVRQIELSGLCTGCRTDLFFSHRKERGKTGRFGTIFILGTHN